MEDGKRFCFIKSWNCTLVYTKLGYRHDDNLASLSLERDTAFAYPEIVFMIRIILGNETFYIVDFSQKSHDISMSAIVYKVSDDKILYL